MSDWGEVRGDEDARRIFDDAKRERKTETGCMGFAGLVLVGLGFAYANGGDPKYLAALIVASAIYVAAAVQGSIRELKTWIMVTEQRVRLIEVEQARQDYLKNRGL